jgi:hypothetical protein
MAKYISNTTEGGYFLNIADDECKSYWEDKQSGLNCHVVSDEDYEKSKWHPVVANDDSWSFNEITGADGNPVVNTITAEHFQEKVEDYTNKGLAWVRSRSDLPAHYSTMESELVAWEPHITGGITFPVEAKNWIKVCMDNGIAVPFASEWF